MQTHDLSIKVLSPVHIGTGDQPGRKERWFQDGKVWLVDEEALFRRVNESPHLLTRFERFAVEERASLWRFFQDTGIEPETVALYGIRRLGGAPYSYYLTHIKVPGRPPGPYIPGSTLKGAMRSALLRSALLEDSEMPERAAALVQEGMGGYNPAARSADDPLEKDVFGRDQHHEWTRLFGFSDTDPVPTNRLWSSEVRILSMYGSEPTFHFEEKEFPQGRPIVLNPEVLRMGATLQGRLTIYDELLQGPADAELEFPRKGAEVSSLFKACNRVAQEQIEQEWTFARRVNWAEGQKFYGWMVSQLEKAVKMDGCLLRMGWGTGYDDKTVTDLLDDDTFDNVRRTYGLPVGQPGRRGNTYLPKELSPKSRKVVLDTKGRWLPLGWVMLSLTSQR